MITDADDLEHLEISEVFQVDLAGFREVLGGVRGVLRCLQGDSVGFHTLQGAQWVPRVFQERFKAFQGVR